MNDLPFWAYGAITFLGLLGTGGIVMLMATSKRNNPPKKAVILGETSDRDFILGETKLGNTWGWHAGEIINTGEGSFLLTPIDITKIPTGAFTRQPATEHAKT